MPYGPRPRGRVEDLHRAGWPGRAARRSPVWPVNQSVPVAVEGGGVQVGAGRSPAAGRRRPPPCRGSTRTMAFRPPSVIHGAPSGPTITPCGAEPAPSGISRSRRVAGSSQPSVAVALGRVPDAAVGGGRDVVRVVPARARDTRCRARPAAAARAAPPAPGAASRRSGRGRPGGSGLPRAGGRPRPPPARAPHAPRTGARPRRRRRQCCPCAARQRASGGAPRARTAIAPSGPSRARRARSGGSRNPARQRRYRPLLAPAELRAGWPAPRRGPRH